MKDELDDIEQLLPWLANDSLDDEQRDRVIREVEKRPALKQEFEFLISLRKGVRQERAGSPGAFGLKRLQDALENMESSSTASLPGAIEMETPRWWKFSLAAAVLVIVLQAGSLLHILNPSLTVLEPLSVDDGSGLVLQLEFQPQTTESEIRELLLSIDAYLIDGPSALGIYRARVAQSDQSPDAVIGLLRSRKSVIKYVERN